MSDRPRRRARHAFAPFPWAVLAMLTASCATSLGSPPPRAGYEPPTTVSGAVTLGAPALAPEIEIEYLARHRSTPALLRRAWLELQLRHADAALDAAAQVLYGSDRPSANDEAFARFLRAEAYRQQGHPERGHYDLERARALALDPELQRRMVPASQPPGAVDTADGLALAVEPRSAWQPRAENRTNLDPMGRPSRLTIHHSAMYFRDTRPNACAAQIQRIQREHMNRGYGDIGYHFLIDPSGRIWQGRELRWQGAHASGANNIGNIGICLLGNFVRQREGQGPTDQQVRAMRQLVVQLMRRYSFGPDELHCHSDFKATECPGPLMIPLVQQLARELRAQGGYVAAGD